MVVGALGTWPAEFDIPEFPANAPNRTLPARIGIRRKKRFI
jgi:hypothetical protein